MKQKLIWSSECLWDSAVNTCTLKLAACYWLSNKREFILWPSFCWRNYISANLSHRERERERKGACLRARWVRSTFEMTERTNRAEQSITTQTDWRALFPGSGHLTALSKWHSQPNRLTHISDFESLWNTLKQRVRVSFQKYAAPAFPHSFLKSYQFR